MFKKISGLFRDEYVWIVAMARLFLPKTDFHDI